MHDDASVEAEQLVGGKSIEKVVAKRYSNMPRFDPKRRIVNL